MQTFQVELIRNTDQKDDLPVLKSLINLKCLYSKLLPKMARQYLVKLLFDTYHFSMIFKINNNILAGLTFRPFDNKSFYQIAFLAVDSTKQCQGFGSTLMNKFKNHCQIQNIQRIFTYADDGAIGFFQKHGFSQNITLPKQQYKGYIKEYKGGKLMQCKLDLENKIDFENLKDQIQKCKEKFMEKVKSLICLAAYDVQKSAKIIGSKTNQQLAIHELAEFIPGLKEVGYDKRKFQKQQKGVTIHFLLECQNFLDLAAGKRNILIENIKEYEEKKNFNQKDYVRKIKISEQYDILLYKMQVQLLHGHFKYKSQFEEEFGKRIRKIIGQEENLKGRQKQFVYKMKQLRYEFIKNQLDFGFKDKKMKNKSLPKI